MSQESDGPKWYAIYTYPNQENRAADNLLAWGVETFCPKLKESRSNPFSGAVSYFIKHLFPQYIFARFEAEKLFHKVCFTRGVRSVVGFGGAPVPIADGVIETIRSRIGDDGLVRIGEALRPGDTVLIKNGPLKGFTGIFERQMKASDRVMILLMTINYQGHVSLDRGEVEKSGKRVADAGR